MDIQALFAVNWLAVLVAGVAGFMLGALWYALLFGKAWVKAYALTDEQIAKMSKNPGPTYGGLLACNLLFALGTAMLLNATGGAGVQDGLLAAGLVAFFILLPLTLATQIGGGRSLRGFLIDWGLQASALLLAGAILGAWR